MSEEQKTDNDGKFRFKEVPVGIHTIIATSAGFGSAGSEPFEVVKNETTRLAPIKLRKGTGAFTGKVLLQQERDHSASIVTIIDTQYSAISYYDGSWNAGGIPSGRYAIRAEHSGFIQQETDARVIKAGEVTTVETMTLPKHSPDIGTPCRQASECDNGYCVDGVCCESSCAGPCRTCNGDTDGSGVVTTDEIADQGFCMPYKEGLDFENDCENLGSCLRRCDGAGSCRVNGGSGIAEVCLNQGDDCSETKEDRQCTTLNCVDGFCCDTACTGTCETCSGDVDGSGDVEDDEQNRIGVCSPFEQGVDPEDECAEQDPASCGKTGVCSGSGSCLYYDETTACGDETDDECTNPDTCDGMGACQPNHEIEGTPCGEETDEECFKPYACDGMGACQPNFEIAGTPCGDDTDTECDNPDSCNSSGECVPNYSPKGNACDGNDNPMTVDKCDGEGSCEIGDDYCDTNTCWKIPPTGVTMCSDYLSQIPCPGVAGSDTCATTAFCGQDGQYPDNERAFTDETVQGDVIVTDSLTGLVWQSDPAFHVNWSDSVDYCSNSTYAGRSDWRLPNVHELSSLLNYGKREPGPDFISLSGDCSWTSEAKCVYSDGYVSSESTDNWHDMTALCVRGERVVLENADRYYTNYNDDERTVLDRATGLLWQGQYTADTLRNALMYCEALESGGYSDWRLPNIHELISLMNVDGPDRSWDFQGMPSEMFWSSTPFLTHRDEYDEGRWWTADIDGVSESTQKNSETLTNNIRCVRGGP